MAKLEWDKVGERFFETGVDRGVLYPQEGASYGKGVAWNGLTGVTESPDGAEPTDFWADNIKYASIRSAETFGCTITAYTYPEEFAECDGSAMIEKGIYIGQQTRKSFGFSYRTLIGNDTSSEEDDGYKIHLVYGATASPSEKDYGTVNDSPDAVEFSWEVETVPVPVDGYKATATLVIDSTKVDKEKLAEIEKILYGDGETEPRLIMPNEVLSMLQTMSVRSSAARVAVKDSDKI